MQLKWVGDPRLVVGVGGWPAADHDEPNNKLAEAKLSSKLYERVTPKRPAKQEEAS
jgi:hypothetical protein